MTSKTLSANLIQAWQKTVLSLSRLSNKDKQDPNLSAMIRKLTKEERPSLFKLREAFTIDREALTYSLLSHKENIVAYMLGFHLQNIFRLEKTFERVETKWKWSLKNAGCSSLSIWDLGCGSGALSQFFAEKFAPSFASSRVYLYDTNSLLLNASKLFFEHLSLPNLKIFPRKVGLHDLNTAPNIFPDELVVIGLGYVWNELGKNKIAQGKIQSLIKHYLENKAKVMLSVMEPAQDFAARSAMKLHDDMIALGFIPLYPCPHQENCPMLSRSKDWCYSEFSSEDLPSDAQAIDKLLEIDRTLIASAAYVYVSPALFETIKKPVKHDPIIVGRPRERDGESFTYLLCDPEVEIRRVEGISSRGRVTLRGDSYRSFEVKS